MVTTMVIEYPPGLRSAIVEKTPDAFEGKASILGDRFSAPGSYRGAGAARWKQFHHKFKYSLLPEFSSEQRELPWQPKLGQKTKLHRFQFSTL